MFEVFAVPISQLNAESRKLGLEFVCRGPILRKVQFWPFSVVKLSENYNYGRIFERSLKLKNLPKNGQILAQMGKNRTFLKMRPDRPVSDQVFWI